MSRDTAGEGLPALHDYIDIGGVELVPAADPTGHLGGDQARARAEKRVIDRLTGPSVVGDRAAHAFNRFLRPVPPTLLAFPVTKRVVIGDRPDRRLRAVTIPLAALALPHRVPAGLMLPVIIPTAQGEVLLDPDDLRAQLQPASRQAGGDDIAVQCSVPDIGDVAGKSAYASAQSARSSLSTLPWASLPVLRPRRARQDGS